MKKNKISKIAIFFNNKRGLKLSYFLKSKGFVIHNIVTKKFLNKEIISKLSKKNLRIINNLKSKKILSYIKQKKLDLIIAAGFPHKFKPKFFNICKFGIINLHAGKLPIYRGGSPLVWQILENERKIGITIIKINNLLDGGDIICSTNFKNDKRFNIEMIQNKANKLFLNLTLKAIKILEKNLPLTKQPYSKSYFKQRTDKDALINFNKSNNAVYNLVRAQSAPYKGAFFFNNKKKFRLIRCVESRLSPKVNIGKIFKIKLSKEYFVKCRKKSIKIIQLKPDKKYIKDFKIL